MDNIDPVIDFVSEQSSFRLEAIVLDAVSSPDGKWPSLMGNVVVMDSSYLLPLLQNVIYNTPLLQTLQSAANLIPGLNFPPINVELGLQSPHNYAFTITVQYKNRLEAYQKSRAAMRKDIIEFSNSIYTSLGIDFAGENFVPLASYLDTIIPILFRQSFLIVDVIVLVLSCLLIYNLMLENIADKVYEYGMLRALGLVKKDLSKILVFQALAYALPGTAIGIVGAVIIFLGFGYYIATEAAVKYPSEVSMNEDSRN